ncbi:MAG: hypothetical protein M1817_001113 [Caeruleum heppii]|nr:MAG: hypothetical protein M1817_001113 [Caeruleum heppii]
MEDSNLIATLIPIDDKEWAKNAFRLDHNQSRYLSPARGIAEGPTISSREATPGTQQPDDDAGQYDSAHRIQLTFDVKPKDPTKGYTFGTNPQTCDVLLGYRGAYRISGRHFWITFNQNKRLILEDFSTYGTAVSYNGQAKDEVRNRFIWILDLKPNVGRYDVQVHIHGLSFKVELATHNTCEAEYGKKVNDFLKDLRTASPPLGGLGIYTPTADPSESLTPKRLPIYIREQNLGSGSFGGVDKVIDMSTGSVYARKDFYEPRRETEKEDWLNQISREIRIMKENPHEHIVRVIDSWEGPSPFLVMPYFPLGNLDDLDGESRVVEEETVALLFQTLKALEYLHPRGVAHRDLKPENILVESRQPFRVKLADFGLANDRSDLETRCGTRTYAAPEVYLGANYTVSVDLWSLGVIVLQYVYGLPRPVRGRRAKPQNARWMEEWGLAWCKRIVDYATDWNSDALIDLLTTGMLRMRPEERLSAGACVTKGYDLQLFAGQPLDSGSATPTPRTSKRHEIGNDDDDDNGSTTTVLGKLWDAEPGTIQDRRRPSHGDGHRSRLGRLGTTIEQCDSPVPAPADHLSCPLEAPSTCPGAHKRQRSPATGSTRRLPSSGRGKGRQSAVWLPGRSVSRSYGASDHRVGHPDESSQFRTMHDALLALLTDLLELGESASHRIDDHTNTLVGELCEHFAQLKITGVRLTQNDLSGQAIVTAVSYSRETMLARLTPSDLMSSTADLAAHLLHMVQFQSSQPRSPAMALLNDNSLQARLMAPGNRSPSGTADHVGSQITVPTAQQRGMTNSSALWDTANVSNGSKQKTSVR